MEFIYWKKIKNEKPRYRAWYGLSGNRPKDIKLDDEVEIVLRNKGIITRKAYSCKWYNSINSMIHTYSPAVKDIISADIIAYRKL